MEYPLRGADGAIRSFVSRCYTDGRASPAGSSCRGVACIPEHELRTTGYGVDAARADTATRSCNAFSIAAPAAVLSNTHQTSADAVVRTCAR
jgi:hypothetical protein